MSLDGATGYDAVSANTAPGAAVTDFSLYVQFDPSASWWAAYEAAGSNPGKIRVARYDGAVEYARDVLVTPTADLVMLRVLWPGAQSGMPSLQVYPDATDVYADNDTYGADNTYDAYWLLYYPLEADANDRTVNALNGTYAGSYGAAKVGNGTASDGALTRAMTNVYPLTLMTWAKRTLGSDGVILEVKGTYYNARLHVAWSSGSSDFAPRARSQDAAGESYSTSAERPVVDQWFHQAGVFASTTSRISYCNGNAAAANTFERTPTAPTGMADAANYVRLDDVQIHITARAAAWIAYEYTITNDAAGIWSEGGWTPVGGPAGHPAFARFANVPFCHGYRGGRVA